MSPLVLVFIILNKIIIFLKTLKSIQLFISFVRMLLEKIKITKYLLLGTDSCGLYA